MQLTPANMLQRPMLMSLDASIPHVESAKGDLHGALPQLFVAAVAIVGLRV